MNRKNAKDAKNISVCSVQLSLWRKLWSAGMFLAVACGQSERNQQPPPSEEGAGAWPPIPEECTGLATAYLAEDCLKVLHAACRAQTTEQSCAAQGKAIVGDYEMSCTWVPVVTYQNGENCSVESVTYRCEAWMNPEQLGLPCPDPCELEPDLWSAWHSIAGERELLKICGHPVGPWLVTGQAREKWEGYSSTCLDNVTPPPPALCDCTPTACAAVAQSDNE